MSLPYFPLGENGVILSPVRYPAKNVIAVLFFLAKSVIIYGLMQFLLEYVQNFCLYLGFMFCVKYPA